MRALAICLLLSSPAVAQVSVRQATPEETAKIERGPSATSDVEIANPMLFEIPVAKLDGANALRNVAPKSEPFKTRQTRKYVCDKARVEEIKLTTGKLREKANTVSLELAVTVASGWFRQDVDVTLDFLDPDGKKILPTRHWDDETIGNNVAIGYGGKTKVLKTETAAFSFAELERLGAMDRPSMVRILVEIQDEHGDEDED